MEFEAIFRTSDILCTFSLYMINGSHVHRLLVHVHMYIMYFLSVVLVLGKDVIRLCSYRVKSEGSHNSYPMFLDFFFNWRYSFLSRGLIKHDKRTFLIFDFCLANDVFLHFLIGIFNFFLQIPYNLGRRKKSSGQTKKRVLLGGKTPSQPPRTKIMY